MNFDKAADFNISIVIPAIDAEQYLPKLLKKLESQTLSPKEIIVIDSSLSNKTADMISVWRGLIPIIYRRVDSAYPGHARNIGIALAKEEWIAFLDCRTLPDSNWLEIITLEAKKHNADFVSALRISDADTHFKKILRAASYGSKPTLSLAGSLVLKTVFEKTGYFISDLRAGEDIEWLSRLKSLGVSATKMDSITITYDGLAVSLKEAIQKWFLYAISKREFEVRNDQKLLYLVSTILISLFFVWKWNAIFAQWNVESFYYIPNITKIFLLFLFLSYALYRGIVRPILAKEKLSFLLPWRWLEVFFVGLCLDLAKAPGLVLGAILLIKRRLLKKGKT